MNIGEPLLLKQHEAAKLLSISPRTLYTLTKKGIVPAVNLGNKCVRYSKQALQNWVNQQGK